MALQYETGTPTSPEDLVNKLQTFAATHGWTVDDYDATENECTMHSNNCYVHMKWADSGTEINLCQSLGYTADNEVDNMPNDSGNGSATVGNERRVDFDAAGSYTAYHFFASDAAPRYIHIVVEVSSGIFRHFGFGTINKFNDWTGGEYVYGHIWQADVDNPQAAQNYLGLDGFSSAPNADVATLHMEGVGDQGVSDKWAVVKNTTPASAGTDTAGEARWVVYGGWRAGLYSYQYQAFHNSVLNAYVPIYPYTLFYRNSTPVPDEWIYLGVQQNIGGINMDGFSPGDEVTLGGETWKIFPWVRKQYLKNSTQESWNAGVAYRKS